MNQKTPTAFGAFVAIIQSASPKEKALWITKALFVFAAMTLALAGCEKTTTAVPPPTPIYVYVTPPPTVAPATPTLSPSTPVASIVAAATPTIPAPATPTRQLAPPGIFYLIVAARVETDSGITGLRPGTGVKLLHDDVYLTSAGEAHLYPEQLTNDLAVARAALATDQQAQTMIQQANAADAAMARKMAAQREAEQAGATQAAVASVEAGQRSTVPGGGMLDRAPTVTATHSAGSDQQGEKQIVNGTVIQKMTNGILVVCEDDGSFGSHKAQGTVFVTGNVQKYFADQKIHVHATPAGTYTYTTVQGAESVIPQFELK